MFLTGSYANVVNSTRRVGVLLAPLIVFIPVGLAYLTRARDAGIRRVLLLGFALAPLAAVAVVPEPYAVDRELVLLPFAVLIAMFGVRALLTAERVWLRRAVLALLLLIPLDFAFFCWDYWRDYPSQIVYWFEGNHREALEAMIDRAPGATPTSIYFTADRLPYIDAYWRFYLLKNHREDLLGRTTYIAAADVPHLSGGHSLLLMRDDDATTSGIDRWGSWRRVATFVEVGNAPLFTLLER